MAAASSDTTISPLPVLPDDAVLLLLLPLPEDCAGVVEGVDVADVLPVEVDGVDCAVVSVDAGEVVLLEELEELEELLFDEVPDDVPDERFPEDDEDEDVDERFPDDVDGVVVVVVDGEGVGGVAVLADGVEVAVLLSLADVAEREVSAVVSVDGSAAFCKAASASAAAAASASACASASSTIMPNCAAPAPRLIPSVGSASSTVSAAFSAVFAARRWFMNVTPPTMTTSARHAASGRIIFKFLLRFMV